MTKKTPIIAITDELLDAHIKHLYEERKRVLLEELKIVNEQLRKL